MQLIILGAGGYGHVIEDMAIQSEKYEDILFLDDNSQDKCSTFLQYKKEDTEFYPAFGNNAIRMEWLRRLEEKGNDRDRLCDTAYVGYQHQCLDRKGMHRQLWGCHRS